MLCGRMKRDILNRQAVDQAAYREGFSTDDHLLALSLLVESCNEWNTELWLALVDFEKAFDTVEHDALWSALRKQGIGDEYVCLLQKLYCIQTATVNAGVGSRAFTLARVVKQGDPISCLLFLCVMEECFANLKARWNDSNTRRVRDYFGYVIDNPSDPLTNLRFADDVIIVAGNKRDVGRMVAHLATEAAKFGLKIHAGKTKILTNVSAQARPAQLLAGSNYIQVLTDEETERYLGRRLTLKNSTAIEIDNRIASGWAAFGRLKHVLCNRCIKFTQRLRLFETAVTPAVLCGCAAWTLNVSLEQKVEKTRRTMIRKMLMLPRLLDETWVEYIRRSTHKAEAEAASRGYEKWVVVARLRKWTFAGKTARQVDGRWTTTLLEWRRGSGALPSEAVVVLLHAGWMVLPSTLAATGKFWRRMAMHGAK